MSIWQQLRALLDRRPVQLAALVALLVAVGIASVTVVHAVQDPDVWWQLKVGDWILQNHAVPHTGILSRTAADRPWIAYSWGYEILLSACYSLFGLPGIAINGLALTVAICGALFWSTYRLSLRFWLSWTLTLVACAGFILGLLPRPVFFSMIFFAVLLTALLEYSRTDDRRILYWLPALFCLWANIHIQFVYGLFVLGLFAFSRTVEQRGRSVLSRCTFLDEPPTVSLPALWITLAACTLATCVGPYGIRLYQVILNYSKSKVTYTMIIELLAPSFTSMDDYVVLFLAAAAFFILGWRRRADLFRILLLVAACIFTFRTRRDNWFLCMTAAAFIAEAFRIEDHGAAQGRWRKGELAAVAAGTLFCLVLAAPSAGITKRALGREVAEIYPVNAVNFLRQNPYPGPIFNSFDWGGFLTWYAPQYPVSIDGRNDLYGDALDVRLYGVEAANRPYNEEPVFKESRLVLLEPTEPLAQLLSADPAFQLVYRDNVSVLFVRK